MKVAIVQSNYIPWRGYFDLIDEVDLFVFYDDVKYTAKNWRNRNRIKTANGPMWLSVPVRHGHSTLIQEAEIDHQQEWVNKHVRSLTLAYQKAPFFKAYAAEFFDLLSQRFLTISALNVAACRWVIDRLGIRTRTCMSAELGIAGPNRGRRDRPLAVLRHLGAATYLSGPTARAYTDVAGFAAAGIGLEFKSYEYPEYPQLHGAFEPHVTVLDLLFNCGDRSRDYLKSLKPNERVL